MKLKRLGLVIMSVLIVCLAAIILISQVAAASDEEEFTLKTKQYSQKVAQLADLQAQLDKAVSDYSVISAKYETTAKNVQGKRNAYLKAQDEYERAIKNIDLIQDEQLAQLTQEYKRTKKELTNAEDALKTVENEKNYSEHLISGLLDQKKQKEQELLALKADLFDISERTPPLWVEGYGEAILDENKTPNECQKLALEYATRDAIERGGKAMVESVTKVEMFELVKDDIKVTAKVQILEQDTSGDYGKAKQVISGEIIKYTAKVRIKIQNINTYNPYRDQLTGSDQKSDIPANSSSQAGDGQTLLEKPRDATAKTPENKIVTPENTKPNNTKRHQEAWMNYLGVNLPLLSTGANFSFEDRICYEFKSGVSLGVVGGYGFGYDYYGYWYISLGPEVGYDLPLGHSSYLTISGTTGGTIGSDGIGLYLKADIGFKTKLYTNIQLDCFGKLGPYDATLGTRLMVGIPLYVKK